MKIFTRTVLILVAAMLVVGLFYALVQSPWGAALGAGGHHGEDGHHASFVGGERPEGFARHEGRGASLFGLAEVLKNLTIVAVSVILITLGSRFIRNRRDGPRRAEHSS
jgi:hypothetical protein